MGGYIAQGTNTLNPAVAKSYFNFPLATNIYHLSLHDALPICLLGGCRDPSRQCGVGRACRRTECSELYRYHTRSGRARGDRKSTRLNSSHTVISYAVFCLKKKMRDLRLHGRVYRTRHEHLESGGCEVLFQFSSRHEHLPSFPTRRSSDLSPGRLPRSFSTVWCWPCLPPYRMLRAISLSHSIWTRQRRSEEHTSELKSHSDIVCRLLLEKKNARPAASWAGISHKARTP